MIRVDFYLGVALYILFCLAGVFIAWVFSRRQKNKDLTLRLEFIWFCSICSYTYINTKEGMISVCPRCGSYNKKHQE